MFKGIIVSIFMGIIIYCLIILIDLVKWLKRGKNL